MTKGTGRRRWAMAKGRHQPPWFMALANGHGQCLWPRATTKGLGQGPWATTIAEAQGQGPMPKANGRVHEQEIAKRDGQGLS